MTTPQQTVRSAEVLLATSLAKFKTKEITMDKLLGFASVTSFCTMIAFGMWQWEAYEIDQMGTESHAEASYIQCANDYRAVHGTTFKYDMRETCKRIMNGEAVL